MDTRALKAIFTQATISQAPTVEPGILTIPGDDGAYLLIDAASVTDRERALLTLLQVHDETPADAWTDFLLGQTTKAPSTTVTTPQLLHFNVRFTDDGVSHANWLRALCNLFESSIHAAFIDAHKGYVLLKQRLTDDQVGELTDMLGLIDNDFYSNTRLFVGSTHTLAHLPEAFTLEQQLFASAGSKAVQTLAGSLLPFLAGEQRTLLAPLSTAILPDADSRQLITALYQTQGNVRQAAEHLFVHRNTLLYRIEKFEERSGFNLKHMDDLVCCYLLTLA